MGGSFNAENPEIVNYEDTTNQDTLAMVAEDSETYGSKKDGE